MGTPLTPTQILNALHAANLNVVEMPGWRDRCRCHVGSHERGEGPILNGERNWGPFNGVTIHHTAGALYSGDAAIAYAQNILIKGNGTVPGPLCMAGIDGDGRVLLVSAGRANHVGSISAAARDAMVAASFSLDGWQDLRGRGIDGNTHTVGFEVMNPGAPTAVQQDAAIRASAAICAAAGWTGQETHGHGEVSDSRGYTDPGLDMGAFRRSVMSIIASSANSGSGAGGGLPQGGVPVPPTPQTPPAVPVLRLDHLVVAMLQDSAPDSPTGRIHYGDPAGAIAFERALVDVGLLASRYVDGSLGTMTRKAYANWQLYLGYRGAAADGIPGRTSLIALSNRTHRFTVA